MCVAAKLGLGISKLVTDFKDKGQLALAQNLAVLCSAALESTLRELQSHFELEVDSLAVSWVPSSRSAKRRRGFDPNRHILRHTMRLRSRDGLTALPLVAALRHTARNRDQSGLNREERFVNTSQSFLATGKPRRVLLFDDILTTGATLGAALAALEAADFEVLGCFAIAETPLRATSGASRIATVG